MQLVIVKYTKLKQHRTSMSIAVDYDQYTL